MPNTESCPDSRPIEDAIQARITQLEEQIAELSVSLHHARQLAESAHRVAELAWGGEIPSPLPGHRRQTEEEFAAEMERLNCPLCGGSGHVGDADTAIAERIAQLETVAEAAKEVLQDIDPRSDDYTQHCATLEEALQAAGYGRE